MLIYFTSSDHYYKQNFTFYIHLIKSNVICTTKIERLMQQLLILWGARKSKSSKKY